MQYIDNIDPRWTEDLTVEVLAPPARTGLGIDTGVVNTRYRIHESFMGSP